MKYRPIYSNEVEYENKMIRLFLFQCHDTNKYKLTYKTVIKKFNFLKAVFFC